MLIDELMLRDKKGTVFRRIFRKQKSMKRYAKKFNGDKDIYYSVYQFTGIDVNSDGKKYPCDPIVDRVYLDFDVKDDPNFPDHVRKVAKHLYDNKYEFYIRFSGRGFHIFISLDDYELDFPANAIRGWVADLHKKTETKSDSSVVGDLRRVSRALHYINLKSGRYCIPISYDELMNKSYEEIYDMAKEDRECEDFYNGNSLLNIAAYDSPSLTLGKQEVVYTGPVEFRDDMCQHFPPCIKAALSNPMLGNKDRINVIVYLRDIGYSKEETKAVFKKFLSPEKYNHVVNEEKQIKYIYEEEKYLFYCTTMKKHGKCPDEECEGIDIYY